MRCAHCGQQMRFRDWFQYRFDLGYRCASCRKVFYADDSEVRKRIALLSGLFFAGTYLGFLVLISEDLINGWAGTIVYFSVSLLIGVALFALALEDAPTLPTLPRHLMHQRKWMQFGLLGYFAVLFVDSALRWLGADYETGKFVPLVGVFIWMMCIAVGRWRNPQPSASAE